MFILNNYDKEEPFTITKKKNVISLSNHCDNVEYVAVEERRPVQYFCRKRNDDNEISVIRKSSIIPAKMFSIGIVYEKEGGTQQEVSYDLLVHEYGDKGARDRIKRREMGDTTRVQSMQVNVTNQILPEFNRNTENVKEAYKLELLFNEKVLEGFGRASVEPEDLSCFLERYQASETNAVHLAAIDCLYKILSAKNVNNIDLPESYTPFYSEVKKDATRGRLSSLLRDKLVVKLYVLLLMINDYTLHYNEIPVFDAPKQKITGILKMIGCSMSSNGIVSLTKLPQETFTLR
ncbi:hypothetical protein PAEPH01_2517 [Pancytospora epiphaga]|nr:hypothetical protein PAEPH01_2517 [Pancytospora epiphaga]